MESIKTKAFALLAKKAYFSKQLKLKLSEKGYPQNEIEELISDLTQRGWLNDQELAGRYIEQQKQRGYGSRMIAFKLKEKAGFLEIPIAESEEALMELIKRRYLKDLPEKKAKVINSLLRRGYSYDLICNVLREIKDGS